jgi:chromosome segregation ATPase
MEKENKLFQNLENLEKQIEVLKGKILKYKEVLDSLKLENEKLKQDIELLKEENKKLQVYYKEFINLKSKTETVRQKLRKLVEKISVAI